MANKHPKITYKFRLDDILKEKGMAIARLASDAGINYRTALDMVHNTTKGVTLEVLSKVCSALEIPPGDLFKPVK